MDPYVGPTVINADIEKHKTSVMGKCLCVCVFGCLCVMQEDRCEQKNLQSCSDISRDCSVGVQCEVLVVKSSLAVCLRCQGYTFLLFSCGNSLKRRLLLETARTP